MRYRYLKIRLKKISNLKSQKRKWNTKNQEEIKSQIKKKERIEKQT